MGDKEDHVPYESKDSGQKLPETGARPPLPVPCQDSPGGTAGSPKHHLSRHMLCAEGQPYREQRAGRGEVTGKAMTVTDQVSGGAVRGRARQSAQNPPRQGRWPCPLQPARSSREQPLPPRPPPAESQEESGVGVTDL